MGDFPAGWRGGEKGSGAGGEKGGRGLPARSEKEGRWQGKREQKEVVSRPGGVFSGHGDYSECLGAMGKEKEKKKQGRGKTAKERVLFLFQGADSAGRGGLTLARVRRGFFPERGLCIRRFSGRRRSGSLYRGGDRRFSGRR